MELTLVKKSPKKIYRKPIGRLFPHWFLTWWVGQYFPYNPCFQPTCFGCSNDTISEFDLIRVIANVKYENREHLATLRVCSHCVDKLCKFTNFAEIPACDRFWEFAHYLSFGGGAHGCPQFGCKNKAVVVTYVPWEIRPRAKDLQRGHQHCWSAYKMFTCVEHVLEDCFTGQVTGWDRWEAAECLEDFTACRCIILDSIMHIVKSIWRGGCGGKYIGTRRCNGNGHIRKYWIDYLENGLLRMIVKRTCSFMCTCGAWTGVP